MLFYLVQRNPHLSLSAFGIRSVGRQQKVWTTRSYTLMLLDFCYQLVKKSLFEWVSIGTGRYILRKPISFGMGNMGYFLKIVELGDISFGKKRADLFLKKNNAV